MMAKAVQTTPEYGFRSKTKNHIVPEKVGQGGDSKEICLVPFYVNFVSFFLSYLFF